MSDENRKTISMYEQEFPITAPYAAGHSLNEAEAKALNQLRGENISNNFRKRVRAALDGTPLKEGGSVETLADIAAAIADYDAKYEFSMPSAGRGEPIDPVEREALRIARELVKKALAAKGKRLKDVDEEKFEAKVAEIAATEKVQKEAKRRVAAAEKASEDGLGDLDI